jgi:hypothetical protein
MDGKTRGCGTGGGEGKNRELTKLKDPGGRPDWSSFPVPRFGNIRSTGAGSEIITKGDQVEIP